MKHEKFPDGLKYCNSLSDILEKQSQDVINKLENRFPNGYFKYPIIKAEFKQSIKDLDQDYLNNTDMYHNFFRDIQSKSSAQFNSFKGRNNEDDRIFLDMILKVHKKKMNIDLHLNIDSFEKWRYYRFGVCKGNSNRDEYIEFINSIDNRVTDNDSFIQIQVVTLQKIQLELSKIKDQEDAEKVLKAIQNR